MITIFTKDRPDRLVSLFSVFPFGSFFFFLAFNFWRGITLRGARRGTRTRMKSRCTRSGARRNSSCVSYKSRLECIFNNKMSRLRCVTVVFYSAVV